MEGMGVGDIAESAAAVAFDYFGGNVPYGGDALEIGPEVPPFAVADGVVPHFLSKQHITAERLKDVLPWAYGLGRPYVDGIACLKGTDAIGDYAVRCPVATADDVAGADARN